jgi:hypothetical protein
MRGIADQSLIWIKPSGSPEQIEFQRIRQQRRQSRISMFYLQEGFTYLFSIADEIKRLDGLKKAGSISDAEFARLRARLIQ